LQKAQQANCLIIYLNAMLPLAKCNKLSMQIKKIRKAAEEQARPWETVHLCETANSIKKQTVV